jgi:hypothetical protein
VGERNQSTMGEDISYLETLRKLLIQFRGSTEEYSHLVWCTHEIIRTIKIGVNGTYNEDHKLQ